VAVVGQEAVERGLGARPREVLEAIARRPRELRRVARPAGEIEPDASVLSPDVHEPAPEAGAVHPDAPLRDRARDLAEPRLVLLGLAVHPQGERRDRNQDQEQEPHLQVFFDRNALSL
jgi:hypothetical protein